MSFSWPHWLSFTFSVKFSFSPLLMRVYMTYHLPLSVLVSCLFLYSTCCNHIILLAIFEYAKPTSRHLYLEFPVTVVLFPNILTWFSFLYHSDLCSDLTFFVRSTPTSVSKIITLSLYHDLSSYFTWKYIVYSSLSSVDWKFHEDKNFVSLVHCHILNTVNDACHRIGALYL